MDMCENREVLRLRSNRPGDGSSIYKLMSRLFCIVSYCIIESKEIDAKRSEPEMCISMIDYIPRYVVFLFRFLRFRHEYVCQVRVPIPDSKWNSCYSISRFVLVRYMSACSLVFSRVLSCSLVFSRGGRLWRR